MDLDRYIARESPIHAADARLKFIATVAFIVTVSLLPVGSFLALGLAELVVIAVSLGARSDPAAREPGVPRGAVPAGRAAAGVHQVRRPAGVHRPRPAHADDQRRGPLASSPRSPSRAGSACRRRCCWRSPRRSTTSSTGCASCTCRGSWSRSSASCTATSRCWRDESSRMSRARASRSAAAPDGRKGGGSIAWRAKVTGSMVGSLFLRSYERSERIYAAMQARGFEGEFRHLHSRALVPMEYAVLALILLGCVAFSSPSRSGGPCCDDRRSAGVAPPRPRARAHPRPRARPRRPRPRPRARPTRSVGAGSAAAVVDRAPALPLPRRVRGAEGARPLDRAGEKVALVGPTAPARAR